VDSEAAARIREGLELFSRGDYAASLLRLSPDIEWDTSAAVPDGALYRGRDEVLSFWSALSERWENFQIEPERWIEGDDVVLMLGRLAARGIGSGVPVDSTWDQVWTVADGLPVRCENFTDRARAWRASGLDPDGAP